MDKSMAFRRMDGVTVCICEDSLWCMEGKALRQRVTDLTVLPEGMAEDIGRNGTEMVWEAGVLTLNPPGGWPLERTKRLLERTESWLRQGGRLPGHRCPHCGSVCTPRVREGLAVWYCDCREQPPEEVPPEKPTLLQKIRRFFTGRKKSR